MHVHIEWSANILSDHLVVVFGDPLKSFTKTVLILLTCDSPSPFPVLCL